MKRLLQSLAVLGLVFSLLDVYPVRADIAPPEAPPGSTLWPGSETTQVRMLAETVTLTISVDPRDARKAVARTTARFSMQNLGTQTERMQVRFPLRFLMWNDQTFPEIEGLRVKVNGQGVTTQRQVLPYTGVSDFWSEPVEIPWSVFEVSFAPGENVSIEVSYSVHGFGYYPWQAFRYILETGAGWKDSIGSAEIIVQLPYEVNRYNVLLDGQTGFSTTSPSAELSGNEVRWHFEALEPTAMDNIEISLITPTLWQKVMAEKKNITRNPNDGEAWGRLGKAYKEMTREAKGYPRSDPVGLELFQMSAEAYEKCLAILPEDSLWHTGYADLLWSQYYFVEQTQGPSDSGWMLQQSLSHLGRAVELDPGNQLARDLLEEISYSRPEAVKKTGTGYDLLALTVTAAPPTSFVLPTDTAVVMTETEAATPSASPTAEAATITPAPAAAPAPGNPQPLCGGAGLVLPLAGAAWWRGKSRKRR